MARDDVLPTHVGAGGAPVSAWSSRPNSTPSRSAGGFINPVASTSSHFAPPSLEGLSISDDASSATHGVDTRVAATCSAFPRTKALANAGSLPLGALVSPFAPAAVGAPAEEPALRRDPARCARCAAFVSPFCAVDTANGMWRCCFCGCDNSDAMFAVGAPGAAAGFPELTRVDVEYLTDAAAAAFVGIGGDLRPLVGTGLLDVSPLGSASGAGSASTPPAVVFVVDESMDDDESASLRRSLLRCVRGSDPSTRVGFLTYAAAVAAYDLSVNTGVAAAEVLPGSRSPTPEDVEDLVGDGRMYVAPLSECADAIDAIVSSLRPASGGGSVRRRPRCLGPALETAVALLRHGTTGGGGGTAGGRVVVCASGPATRGPGGVAADEDSELFDFEEKAAKEYVDELSITIAKLGVSVDILVGGREAVGALKLAPLADATGGVILLLEDFGESFFENLSAAVRRPASNGAIFTVRASAGIGCARVIGAVEALSKAAATLATAPSLPASDSASTAKEAADAFRLKSRDISQSVAVFLEYAGDVEASHVHVQFVAWFPSPEGGRVARCMTRRIPVAPSMPAYLRGVDSSVAAVLAAKKTALDAQSDAVGPKEACKRVEARVLDVADVFARRDADGGSLHDPFPRELGDFAEAMYHLLRGPMLGTLAGHEDERAAMRQLFLGAGEALARSMLVPRLYVWRGGDVFEKIPPADLALRSVDALVLDHGTDVFVWVGHGVSADEERLAAARGAAAGHAATVAAGRFPVPRVRMFREGSSQARYMVSRLMPLHRDAPHEQDAMFPPVRSLSPNERKALMESFLPTDDFSFFGWMRQLGLAAPLDGSSVKLRMMSGDDTSTTASSLIL